MLALAAFLQASKKDFTRPEKIPNYLAVVSRQLDATLDVVTKF